MSKKLFVYPQHKQKQILNPYTNNMERALGTQFDIVHHEYRCRLPQSMRFLLSSTKADVYVLNWIESSIDDVGFTLLNGLMSMMALKIILFRKAKIVWVFHNIHPHKGETKWSKRVKQLLFQHSSMIVSHSKEAMEHAKLFAQCPVYFKNHPIELTEYGKWEGELRDCDFYLWGNIYPYKGVLELISNPLCVSSARSVLIVGKCGDIELQKEMENYCNDNIVFENRRAPFDEVAAQCKKAKYVLFPYVGDSVSSSGALMDTLMMGGTPVGPNRGAFADLAEQGCCITYNHISEIFSFPFSNDSVIKLNNESVQSFLNNNSWESFAKWLAELV